MDLRALPDETGTNARGRCRSLRSEVPQHEVTVEAAARRRSGSHRRSTSEPKASGRRFREGSRATVGRSVLASRIRRGTKKASDLPASGSNARRREIASDRCCRGRTDICRNRSLRRAASHRASGVPPRRHRIDVPAPPAPATRSPESTRKPSSARLCRHRIPWLAPVQPGVARKVSPSRRGNPFRQPLADRSSRRPFADTSATREKCSEIRRPR